MFNRPPTHENPDSPIGPDRLWRAMALKRLFHEGQRGGFVARPGDKAFEDLAFVIDRAPEVNHLAIELHVHLVEMPAPVSESAHPVDPLPPDVAGEERAKPPPPLPNYLMANVDTALEQEILDVSKR